MISRKNKACLRALLLLALGSLSFISQARGQEACAKALDSAEEKYRRRKHEEAIALVAPCLEKGGLSLSEQERAYTILARAYFSQKENERAAASLRRLWQIAPSWRPDPEHYPPPFCAFVEELFLKEQAARGPAISTQRKDSTEIAVPLVSEKVRRDSTLARKASKPALIYPENAALGLFEINLGAATHVGTFQEREVDTPFLGHMRLGFEFAELEFRRMEIVNKNPIGEAELNTGAMKLQLPEGALLRGLPALTGVFRISLALGHEDAEADSPQRYAKSFKSFALLLAKDFGGVRVQAGPSFSSLSLCEVHPGRSPAENDSLCLEEGSPFHAESKRNIFAPMIALQAPIKSYVHATIALYPTPRYGKPSAVFGDAAAGEELTLRYSLNVGMRVFAFRGLAFDLGGIWRFGDKLKEGVSDNEFRLALGAGFGFSLTEVFHELRQSER